jgi:hypothetical protein
MKRTIFSFLAAAALIFGSAACERHAASELEEGEGGAPKEMEAAQTPAEAAKTHASEGTPANVGGSGPLEHQPKPDKTELQKSGTAPVQKFFPDSK